jgi:2-iminobutanoate/2-iminopropanoate deaminase
MKETIILGELKLPFSHAVRTGNTIFVSGQASVDLDTGAIIPGTFAEEFERSMDNLLKILQAAGCGLSDIVRVGCYVRRDEDLSEFNRLYREYFSEPFPARTTITNCLPPSLLFEFDCVVVAPTEKNYE